MRVRKVVQFEEKFKGHQLRFCKVWKKDGAEAAPIADKGKTSKAAPKAKPIKVKVSRKDGKRKPKDDAKKQSKKKKAKDAKTAGQSRARPKKKSKRGKKQPASPERDVQGAEVASYCYGRVGLSTSRELENERCSVCLGSECSSNDRMLCCSDCQLAVHKSCYGLGASIPGGWLCDACVQLGKSDELRCIVCNQGRIFDDKTQPIKAVQGAIGCISRAHYGRTRVLCNASHPGKHLSRQ